MSLRDAAAKGDSHTVKKLMDEGVGINDEDWDGWTALHFAASNGHFETIDELLLADDINIQTANHHGDTPLHLASMWGHVKCVQVLLDHSASMEPKNSNGQTPVDVAGTGSLALGFGRVSADLKKEVFKRFNAEPERRRLSTISSLSIDSCPITGQETDIQVIENDLRKRLATLHREKRVLEKAKADQQTKLATEQKQLAEEKTAQSASVRKQMEVLAKQLSDKKDAFNRETRSQKIIMEAKRKKFTQEKAEAAEKLKKLRDTREGLDKKLEAARQDMLEKQLAHAKLVETENRLTLLTKCLTENDFGQARTIVKELHDMDAPKETQQLAQDQLIAALENPLLQQKNTTMGAFASLLSTFGMS
ncbi:hypothetical protein SARC_08449 [Sphaeroforma arctica JP610]|uniref:Uncharacterized protein n=1 Tax=Sphaeroforma arctica JP610 TaxID=667725 RepID=A0A0L0FQV8_9EUKA|nr:hypothetical protein SARC_08449 [Sphaeroforma arctica JP610]KNC79150.1 hypothetical protein SARC_08449 [Sphaeroforma arctica JP610]|eukprot:XP_014153052.1 hypothetical protein SARC_08449 [Sphaeroforma arctica JP610]